MRRIRTELEPKLAAPVKGQHVAMMHGGWTVKPNSIYRSTTYTVISEEWEMTVVSPYSEKHQDLAKFVTDCGQVGHVTAVVTKYEPLMVKAFLTRKTTTHISRAAHRLQSLPQGLCLRVQK